MTSSLLATDQAAHQAAQTALAARSYDLNAIPYGLLNHRASVTQLTPEGRRTLSFRSLHQRALEGAGVLTAHGVKVGDRVGIWAKNSLEWLIADMACLACGACSMPFDPNLKSDVAALVELFALKFLWVDSVPTSVAGGGAVPVLALGAPQSAPPAIAWHHYSKQETYTAKFTSGSTGTPKAILTNARHFEHMATHVARLFSFGAHDRLLNFLPLSTWLQRFSVQLSFVVGADVVLARPQNAANALGSERPTVVIAVPQFLKAMYRVQQSAAPGSSFAAAWGGRIRSLWTGSAAIERELLDAYEAAGIPVHEGYGMSETGLIAKNCPGAHKSGTVGRPFPGKEIEFDEQGQVLVRSDYHTNTAYAEASDDASAFRPGGVVATGDTGYLDEDGFLVLTGRLKDTLVLANGKKVAPAGLESRIAASALVRAVCVVGSGRPFLSAVIVPEAGVDRSSLESELQTINEQLSPHERIHAFHLSEQDFSSASGLLTANGKLNRRAIAEHFASEVDALYSGGSR
jgi:long-subunit acyl-CoA synthetase (AMP-forming)